MKIRECIDLIKEMKEIHFVDKKDKEKLLKYIAPTVTKLRAGKKVMKNIEEKVDRNEYDEAANLLKKAARSSEFWPLNDLEWPDLGEARWLALLFMLVGLINIFIWYLEFRHTKNSDSWPKTTGIVINTEIFEHTDDDDYVTGYSPKIEYSYTIYGKPYISDNRSYSSDHGEQAWADSIIKQHPINSLIVVYYHPKKHRMSVLEPGFDPVSYGLIITGYGIFLTGLIIIIVKIKIEINRIKRYDEDNKGLGKK